MNTQGTLKRQVTVSKLLGRPIGDKKKKELLMTPEERREELHGLIEAMEGKGNHYSCQTEEAINKQYTHYEGVK